jgi:hypothetical protein
MWGGTYFFPFFGILEVFDVLNDIGEFLLIVELERLVGLLILREGRVVHVHLLVGVHQVLVVGVGITHTEYQTITNRMNSMDIGEGGVYIGFIRCRRGMVATHIDEDEISCP